MKHVIIGTAGHIDHGKTTLIKALTGRETDRLEEEKKRGISIELGFTYFDLPSGIRAGIIDVPGHEKFIKNMLAGVTGMNLVVLVVAADEGVMAQTREHLEILRFTGITNGVIALTKKDLVDPEWLEMAEEEVRETVRGTFLEDAPIFSVSGRTGDGMDALVAELDRLATRLPDQSMDALPRYGIDRVFTIAGFGTVVTGTLVAGTLHNGQDAMIFPSGKKVKIRNLQVHDANVDTAYAGQRVAINLANVTTEELERGDVLSSPDALVASSMLDVTLEAVQLPFPIENRTRLRLYAGTKEALGRVTLLDTETLESNQRAFCQLRMEEPVSVQPGDHFVVRLYSPLITIGGGVVIDSDPSKKRKGNADDIRAVQQLAEADPLKALLLRLEARADQYPTVAELAQISGETVAQTTGQFRELETAGKVILVDTSDAVTPVAKTRMDALKQEIDQAASDFHRQYPLRPGIGKEALRNKLLGNAKSKVGEKILQLLLADMEVTEGAGIVAKKDYHTVLSPEQEAAAEKIRAQANAEFLPVRTAELGLDAPWMSELLQYLIRQGELLRGEEDMLFSAESFEQGIQTMTDVLAKEGKITVAQTRDLLNTNRKIALALLSAMDQRKITRREGDERVPA